MANFVETVEEHSFLSGEWVHVLVIAREGSPVRLMFAVKLILMGETAKQGLGLGGLISWW